MIAPAGLKPCNKCSCLISAQHVRCSGCIEREREKERTWYRAVFHKAQGFTAAADRAFFGILKGAAK